MLFLYLCMCVHNILYEVLDCATFEEVNCMIWWIDRG